MAIPHIRATISGSERKLPLDPLPFTIGRRQPHSLSIPLPQISRDHASIALEGERYVLTNLSATHGTMVNGAKVDGRHVLAAGDCIEFPNCPEVRIAFEPQTETASLFLTQFRKLDNTGSGREFDRLRLLLDFGQRLRSADVLDDILGAMIDAALRLTGAERGFVFLRGEGGLRLASGRDARGAELGDASALSRSILERAAASASGFVMNDRPQGAGSDLAQSILDHDLRTVVAIPLRDRHSGGAAIPVLGVLYLDSRAASPRLGGVSRELLDMLADEAAQLLVNAQLMRQQEEARVMEQELALAATIQQSLMATDLPELAFARLRGMSQACKQMGGDFFDAVVTRDGEVAVVLADVSGKGAPAALLASSLQGIVHAQLLAGMPLEHIAATANRFICQRLQGEKYATLVIVRLQADGKMEYLNCGHIAPLLVENGRCRPLAESNMPVGLIPTAEYSTGHDRLARGARLLLVTDGVTEAANSAGEMFGDQRLESLACGAVPVDGIAAAVAEFCGSAPLADDLTLVEIVHPAGRP